MVLETKDSLIERKMGVVALYLMGNMPEKISETLAIPVKTVKNDLKTAGIATVEDSLKSDKQVIKEVRHELEIIKRELWSLYLSSKNSKEKLEILSEIRKLDTEKAETVKTTGNSSLILNPGNGKNLWKELKEAFFSKNGNTPLKNEVKTEGTKLITYEVKPAKESAREELVVIEIKSPELCEELPSKSFLQSPVWNMPCKLEEKKYPVKIVETTNTPKKKTRDKFGRYIKQK